MAVRRPLVLIDGRIGELPVADSTPGGVPSYNTGSAVVAFGVSPRDMARVTVSAAAVTASSVIGLMPTQTADHSSDEHLIEQYDVKVANIVPGVGFDIIVIARGKFGLVGDWGFNYSF